MLLQAFILGMLGSLAANIITDPTKQLIAKTEKVSSTEDSSIMGMNTNALTLVSILLTSSAIYLYYKDR